MVGVGVGWVCVVPGKYPEFLLLLLLLLIIIIIMSSMRPDNYGCLALHYAVVLEDGCEAGAITSRRRDAVVP